MELLINIFIWIAYVLSLYFSIFLLLVYLDKKNYFDTEESSISLSDEPLVTVIIPACNEEKTITKTLQSVYELDYPAEKLEVIVVNDGSRDGTEAKIKEFIQDKPNFRILSHANRGKAGSLNRALQEANGEFFACLDADSFVVSSTLKKMLSFYNRQNNPHLAIVTPAMKVYQPKGILQKIQWLEYVVMILFGRLSSHLDSVYVAPGPFSLYRTDIIRKIGGFDEKSITEDQEIAYRLQLHHYLIKQCFDGYVYTTAPAKLKPFYRQRRRWYLGSIICLYQYRNMIGNRKYGDFGLMQMIKNVTGYFLAITGIGIAFYMIFLPLIQKIKSFVLVEFNVIPFLTAFEFKITLLDLLMMNIKKGFIIIFLFMLTFFFFYIAHRNAREKMTTFGWIPLAPYFLFYYLLKGGILLPSK
ncbi:glycosyltransferase family 2 protein [Candidatus Woesearchaeota archaeon]|nr:glycosyltransferase family 2 protein [Candidatus Woesearchaeota archaeon]